jgi:hypothetical protein
MELALGSGKHSLMLKGVVVLFARRLLQVGNTGGILIMSMKAGRFVEFFVTYVIEHLAITMFRDFKLSSII